MGVDSEVIQVDCPICGPQIAKPWTRQDSWRAVQCRQCELRLTWPRPRSEELDLLYARGSYYRERSASAPSAGTWQRRADEIRRCFPGPVQRVVDVGAGEGHLVAGFRSIGLQCEGMEPSAAGRRAAREQYGLDLSASAPTGSFDAATLVHSLEHMPDPIAALRDAARLVRAGGYVFIEVPHAGSIDMWRPSFRRIILDLPFHLYHFVPRTLCRLLTRAELEVVSVRLFNPQVVETLLALRRPPKDDASRMVSSTAHADPVDARHRDRAIWRARVLPWLRERFPGWKFQVVAVRPL
jgi:SAM-dependent methyltransferase